MQILDDFDPSATTNGTMVTRLSGCGVVYLLNESNISLTLTYQDGKTIGILPAWASRLFKIERPVSVIYWNQRNTLSFTGTNPWVSHLPNASGSPQFLVQGESYGEGEFIGGLYQGPLLRQANVGNTVSTNQGNVASVVNDGNTTPTTVVESTPSGASASTLYEDNAGTVTFRDVNGNINFEILAATNDVRIPQGKLGQNARGDIIDTVGGIELILGALGGDFIGKSPASQELWRVNNLGQYSHTLLNTPNVNGIAGTLKLFQPFKGANFKFVIAQFSGFQGNGTQTLALLAAFVTRAWVFATGLPSTGIKFTSGGVAQTMDVLTTIVPGSPGGTTTAETILFSNSIAQVRAGFDSVQVVTGDANTTNSLMLIVGF